VWGCNAIVDSGGYHVVPPAADGNMPPPGDGPPPGVDACTSPMNRQQFENQCQTGQCVSGASAAPTCDGGLCGITAAPPPDASTPPPVDASGSGDGATDAPTLVSCADVGPNVVIATGSTALKNFITQVESVLAQIPGGNNITLVYQESGSCVGVESMVDPVDWPLTKTPTAVIHWYDSSGTAHAATNICDMTGLTADLGFSDVFATTCQGALPTGVLPSTLTDEFGPVQSMNFVVPATSHQTAITLQDAYYVFGGGGYANLDNGTMQQISPWTNPAQYYVRSAGSGTQSMISAALFGLQPGSWWGNPNTSSSGVVTGVQNAFFSMDAGAIEQTIGIVGSDILDPIRQGIVNGQPSMTPTMKNLAVQDLNAMCSFYPDGTSSSYDKKNVRNGVYPIWGPSHLYVRSADIQGNVGKVVNYFTGVTPLPNTPLIANYAAHSVIPTCAMHVTRTDDGHDYQPYTAPRKCDCYYDSKVPGGSTSCTTCKSDVDCMSIAGTTCQTWDGNTSGYCE
jgi:hypothetical protein